MKTNVPASALLSALIVLIIMSIALVISWEPLKKFLVEEAVESVLNKEYLSNAVTNALLKYNQ